MRSVQTLEELERVLAAAVGTGKRFMIKGAMKNCGPCAIAEVELQQLLAETPNPPEVLVVDLQTAWQLADKLKFYCAPSFLDVDAPQDILEGAVGLRDWYNRHFRAQVQALML